MDGKRWRVDDSCLGLLDLIPNGGDWIESEDQKLQLRLGPPGGEGSSELSLGLPHRAASAKRGFSQTLGIEPVGDGIAPPPAAAPFVGWPPVRSFRRNLAPCSSTAGPPPQNQKQETRSKGMFVKINMDGIPIGRKIDLSTHDSYQKLSSAVDELFRDLLAEEGRSIPGLLDRDGGYTLVYEDNEGDRMLVGDIPWDMFVSAVKRLRVLKSTNLSLSRRAASH
ncbi:unnamed protein product [Spirodela intermedia]|uniref:Auxin-responsive protein n=1 Tax=Spirodela intermedia TaxID=51605 RepID=A0A7I8IVG0_SPIIN|nr:unnamed protein product [Spirodela intermedia]CAA6660976.1 unnamed protein product [Spirodela intermedia]